MTRAEKKAREARAAVRTLAHHFAKSAVINHIRSRGLRLWDFEARDISLWAEVWLRENPTLWTQARVRAEELGFAQRQDETEIA